MDWHKKLKSMSVFDWLFGVPIICGIFGGLTICILLMLLEIYINAGILGIIGFIWVGGALLYAVSYDIIKGDNK